MTTETLTRTETDLAATMADIGRRAREAATVLALASPESKVAALHEAAAAVRSQANAILAANADDMAEASRPASAAHCSTAWRSTRSGVEAMARGLEDDRRAPRSGRAGRWPSGPGPTVSRYRALSVPLGVIGIIYESRPNVTADAGGSASRPATPRSCAAARRASIPRARSWRPAARAARGRPAGRRDAARADHAIARRSASC